MYDDVQSDTALFLVNMYEDGVSKDAVLKAYNNIFKTKYGKYICKDMFLID